MRLWAKAAAAIAVPAAILTAAEGRACPDTPHRFDSFALVAPELGRAKRILVYLPPGYDCDAGRRYPVLYLNDGHDLFDWNPFADALEPEVAADIAAREAWYGSWRLDGQLADAAAAGRLPDLIAVGIAADDGWRSGDLVPVAWGGASEGRGLAFGRFVAETLVPAVDGLYRTIDDRRCRGIGGASLGGVGALQIGLVHGDRFGFAFALSPVLGDPAIAAYLEEAWASAREATRMLVDVDDDPIGTADRAWLSGLGPAGTVILAQTPGGRHRIGSWAERAIPAIERLIGACPLS